jgi:hypothetical protein
MDEESLHRPSGRLVVYRNTPFGADACKWTGDPAVYTGRFHRKGEPLPLYASDSYQAALREHELHTEEPLQPAREVLRRVTALAIAGGTQVLLGDHVGTLEATGLTLEQIYDATDYSGCHALVDFAREIPGVVAISTQSNADRRHRTIAILPEHARRVTARIDYWEGSLNLLKMLAPVFPA